MKTVPFNMPQKSVPTEAEAWVHGSIEKEVPTSPAPMPAVPVEPIKRFTIDVPLDLHKRIKTQCAMKGLKMADVVRELLEREFPKP